MGEEEIKLKAQESIEKNEEKSSDGGGRRTSILRT